MDQACGPSRCFRGNFGRGGVMGLRDVDFLRTRRPRLGPWLLAIGGLTLALAVTIDRTWTAQHQEALRQQQAAQALRQQQAAPLPPQKPSVEQRRWQGAQLELRRPWLKVLGAIETATTAPVYLLGLSIDAATGAVKLEAEAPSVDHALAFVTVLDEEKVLQPAVLVSHTGFNNPQWDRPWVKFSVLSQWAFK